MVDRILRVPRREARDALIEFDDGNPDDMVYRAPNRRSALAYHANPEKCPHAIALDDETSVYSTREDAQLRWFYPCRVCTLDWEEAEAYLHEKGIETRYPEEAEGASA